MNVLAIDQGTSATKALLVGPGDQILGSAEVPVAVRSAGDAVETDPEELYASVLAAGSKALASAGARAHAVALANQGETVLAWDRATGQPLTTAIVWQDRRSAGVCARLAGSADRLADITGLRLDPYFAAPKMTWLRENLTGGGVVTTTDTWLLARLGAGYVTDAATASRTLLLDLDAVDWSPEACAAFGLDPGALPEVVDCAAVAGETTAFGPRPLPVAGLAVDQQAALLAEHCLTAGEAKCTYGTGAFLLAATGTRPARSGGGLAASVAWRLAGRPAYCLDGQVYAAGAAVRWLADVGLIGSAADLDRLGGAGTGGATFVPSLAGLGAPQWRPDAHGAFTGLGLGTTREHLVGAVIEGIAAAVTVLADCVAGDLGAPLTALRADGGLTRSRRLMQAQADLLQVPVEIYRSPHATALGVAALARLGAGEAASLAEALGPAEVETTIDPGLPAGQAAERMAAFRSAVRATLAA